MVLTHYSPVLLSIPPENIRKPKSFLMDRKRQGEWNELGVKSPTLF